jgi:hypothetical protein
MAKAFRATAGRAIRTAAGKADSRNKLIGAVRAACDRQHIDDDDRRQIQREVTGKASLADMDLRELGLVLDRLNKGWKGPTGNRAHIGKIRALWWTLYWLGAIDEPNDAALDAFVKRQTGKDRIQFLGNKQAFSVIEALKSWAHREGVAWATEATLQEMREHHPALEMAQLERHAVIDALGTKLRDAGELMRAFYATDYCRTALRLSNRPKEWTARELDACIRLLGKKLRRSLHKHVAE